MRFLLVLLQTTAHAIIPCAPRENLISRSTDITRHILKTDYVDDADRRSAEAYAKEHGETTEAIEHRYAATGDLKCADASSQANVIFNRGTIVTAAHSIYQG